MQASVAGAWQAAEFCKRCSDCLHKCDEDAVVAKRHRDREAKISNYRCQQAVRERETGNDPSDSVAGRKNGAAETEFVPRHGPRKPIIADGATANVVRSAAVRLAINVRGATKFTALVHALVTILIIIFLRNLGITY